MFRELAHQGNLQQMSEDAGVNQGHTLNASPGSTTSTVCNGDCTFSDVEVPTRLH